jgi:hypothetical protein
VRRTERKGKEKNTLEEQALAGVDGRGGACLNFRLAHELAGGLDVPALVAVVEDVDVEPGFDGSVDRRGRLFFFIYDLKNGAVHLIALPGERDRGESLRVCEGRLQLRWRWWLLLLLLLLLLLGRAY